MSKINLPVPGLCSPKKTSKFRDMLTRQTSLLRSRGGLSSLFVAASIASALTLSTFDIATATAATPSVNLGTASTFAVLAASTITNTGSSVISGNIGLSPGTSITGFPPGVQHSGITHQTDALALSAKNATTAAYLNAAGRTPFTMAPSDLGGSILPPGVYKSPSGMALTGTVTLNGGGNLNSVFIFQAGSTLKTASASHVVLENGAQACHVFWQVTSSATLGTSSKFAGTILALSSATLTTGATVDGRVLARNGAVTLDNNRITVPVCRLASSPVTTATTLTTSTTSPIIPVGGPQTGFGGTAGSGSSPFTLLGLGAFAAAGAATTMALRSRRRRLAGGRDSSNDSASGS